MKRHYKVRALTRIGRAMAAVGEPWSIFTYRFQIVFDIFDYVGGRNVLLKRTHIITLRIFTGK